MVVHNPNNWHWVDKNCIVWAKEYFQDKLVGLHAETDSQDVKIVSLSSFEGDCEVSQRKGKVISLFDLRMVMLMEGHVNGKKFEGSITVPEIAFDTEHDDYQFDISIYKETGELNEARPMIRGKLVDAQIRDIFQNFGKDLLSTHGTDIQEPEERVKSTFTRSNQQNSIPARENKPQPSSTVVSKPTTTTSTTSSATGNTAELHLEPTFNVPAAELYTTFLHKDRIRAWTQNTFHATSAAGGGETLAVGDRFELFGGNVLSTLVAAEKDKRLVFHWRSRDWTAKQPDSRLQLEFHESAEYHETKLQVTWTGIPVGEEDRVRANFEEYYVRSIKLTFGFGAVL